MIPTEFTNGGVDGAAWHELLRSFIWVKELYICGALSVELSRALQADEVGLWLLPSLQELAYGHEVGYDVWHARDLFSSFLDARRATGRPVLFSKLPQGPDGHTVSEEDAIKAKRLQNTFAAQRSRKRKLEYQRELEDAIEVELKEKETWRARALILEALLRDKDHEVPQMGET
ncbi:hypothetical protein EDB86DRAFT_2945141 [Lactarius hatsudake]|nr:hypothetical protein EDB86DRAFT_2945141 [Lactarius hatsudake]